ncbi:tetratricopeptide repeat protein [Methyloligella sp. GL2]|nr:tetratricopeptide repeat protein [Methyloligella sp. GL2]
MAHATEETVLGDFDDATFDYYGIKSRFYRKDGKFFVETDGPDGTLQSFEVKYTFGLEPLQQYLIEFPDGRVQSLTIAWDSRPESEGGQRWFSLYPDEKIVHDDVLHWTKRNQNWNFMCAECHSTGLRKNYDAKTDSFHTTWREISVGCEACHGKGSDHVAWAEEPEAERAGAPRKGLVALYNERQGVSWHRDAKTGQPVRSLDPFALRKEVEACGRCHGRRSQISEDWVPGQPLSETHRVALLAEGLYQPDGQMLDEVYNYGSFKESKMFAAGVTCSDCHDPHAAKLKASRTEVCLQCHAPAYAEDSHTHHPAGAADGPDCVSCHMPTRTFMVIDDRHDHSFRVPRPDLSELLDTPNTCTDCHTEESAGWAAAKIEDWFGPERKGFQDYGPAFHAAWNEEADAAAQLTKIASNDDEPAFVRASALESLSAFPSQDSLALGRQALSDPDPMVRRAALEMFEGFPLAQIWPILSPLLADPVRSVRIAAASLLAGMPADGLSEQEAALLASAEADFVAAQELNADRPEARTSLGRFYAAKRDAEKAEAEYKAALRLGPDFVPATVNLADLYRALGREDEALAALHEGLERSPDEPSLYHALGLALVRAKRQDEALDALQKAAALAPENPRYAYVYAVGLNSSGRSDEAIAILQDNLKRHPADRETLMGLISFTRNAGDLAATLRYAEALQKIEPQNRELEALIQTLRQQTGGR